MKKDYDLLVIGAGPAGIAVAADADYHNLGSSLVLEKGDSDNQTIRLYYPDNKRVDAEYKGQPAVCAGRLCFLETTKPIFLESIAQVIAEHRIEIKTSCPVDSIKKDDTGTFTVSSGKDQVFTAKNVVIAIGRMGKPNQPSYYKAISDVVKKSVHFDVSKIRNSSRKILVVGGGNTAVEYALSLSKKFEVTLSYRQAEFSRVNEMNHHLLMEDEKSGRLRILRQSNVASIAGVDEAPFVRFEDGREEIFDQVIFGIGGSSPTAFLQSAGIETDEKGNPLLNEWLESSVEGLYVAGELSVPMGKGSIITSFNSGKTIVEGIMNKRGMPRQPEITGVFNKPPA